MLQTARFVTLDGGRRLRVFDSAPNSMWDAASGPRTPAAVEGRSGCEGRPLIVLEPGLGAAGRSWAGVFHRLAPFARVIAYDRAGYGESDPVDVPARSLAALRDDLLAVIDDAEGEAAGRAPVVFVGHSWGGPIVRAAAAARRATGRRVDGLVLVDPSDEGCDLYFGPMAQRIDRWQARLMEPLARARLLRSLSMPAYAGLPRHQRLAAARDGSTLNAARAASAETNAFFNDLSALRASPIDLADVPVRIISGVRADLGIRAMREGLRTAHQASAAAVIDGEFIDAPASAHGVPFTDPQLVVDTALALARA